MNYYKLPYILYRDYPDFGYLTDNRNFGYDTAAKSSVKVGDRVLSKTGSIFYSVLDENPQSVEALAGELLPLFVGVSLEEIMSDAIEFYDSLADDGFVGSGDNPSEGCYFSYEDLAPKQIPDENPIEDALDGDYFLVSIWRSLLDVMSIVCIVISQIYIGATRCLRICLFGF